MRDLVCDQTYVVDGNSIRCTYARGRIAIEQVVREDDGTRILHPAEPSRAHNQRQLLVRIRRNCLTEELQCRNRRREAFLRQLALRMGHVVREWRHCLLRRLKLRKLAHPDDHAIGWNGNSFRERPGALTVSACFNMVQTSV